MELPEQLKKTRLALRKTQVQFGELLGVSSTTIARWERGEVLPDSPRILELALRQLQFEHGVWSLDASTRKRIRQSLSTLKQAKRDLEKLARANAEHKA